MKNSVNNYLFLGLPGSGKTTFFALMARHLQDTANRTSWLRFKFLASKNPAAGNSENVPFAESTEEFINDCINKIKHQKWPLKTQNYEMGYHFELDKYIHIGRWAILKDYFYQKSIVDYHDYPGEAFEVAFNAAQNENFSNAAESIKENIKNSDGVILIVDSNTLFNGEDNDKLKKTTIGLFRYIKDVRPNMKLAIVFSKIELFKGHVPDLKMLFRNNYGNAWAHLPKNCDFFYVYSLGDVEVKDGGCYPPKKIKPKNILDPIRWMIGF